MATFDISGTTFTLASSLSPVTLTCTVNKMALVQASSPQIIEGYGQGKVQVTPGGSATFELSNGGIWKLIAGSIVTVPAILPISKGGTGLGIIGTAGQVLQVNSTGTGLEYETPTPPTDFINAVADTNTVNLQVNSNELTANVRYQDTADINLSDDATGLKAEFADYNVSQFTNDAGYLAVSVNLATEVTGVLPLANGGTNSANGNIVPIYCGSVQSGTINDAQVFYFGAVQIATVPSATSTVRKYGMPPFNGTIVAATISITPTNASVSNEASTIDFQDITAGTFSTISNAVVFPNTAVNQTLTVTGLNISYLASTEFNLRFTAATFATNPSSVFFTVTLYVRF